MPEPRQPVILVFLDGVGLGLKDPSRNPFTRFSNFFFRAHGGGEFVAPGSLIETDANMGVPGLPQSATGQTALFTGYNGPQVLGRHVTGFPTVSLRPYLNEKSILKVLLEHGFSAALLNSYSEMYLQRLNRPRNERLMSASSLMQRATGQPFFTIEDYRQGRSLYMDLTNWFLRQHGIDIPLVKAKDSGRRLVALAKNYDFCVFEYFFTDKVGHSRSFAAAKRILRHIDEFLEGIWEDIDPEHQTVIIATDHGNMEDLSSGSHTANKVGTIVYGQHSDKLASKVKTLYDIPRSVYGLKNIPFDMQYHPKTGLPTENSYKNKTNEKFAK